VGAHLVERRRDRQFLVATERDAWRLLAVAQRRVENLYAVDLVSMG
jgi:hypothetical protein